MIKALQNTSKITMYINLREFRVDLDRLVSPARDEAGARLVERGAENALIVSSVHKPRREVLTASASNDPGCGMSLRCWKGRPVA